jgi:glycosyltransferase involved in cell wall biosynthesis
MRIAIVTSWFTDVLGGSGTGVFFNSFVAGLRDRGFDVELIAPNLTAHDYVNITLERFLFNTQIRTDHRLKNADLIIGFDYDGYGIDPHNRPPMIASAHALFGDVIQYEREPVRTMVEAQAFFDQVAMQQADRVTAGSEYARQRIIDLYGIAPEKVVAIPHGMMTASWLKRAQAMTRHENDHPVLLAVGKMYPRKRMDILLRAMPRLIELHPTVELRIAGDGLEFEVMQALASDLGITGNVTFMGHVADDETFAREWVQADIFCHPSLQETFGYVYLEAMSLGKPIVASRAGAAPEVVDRAGLLVEPEDSAGWTAALDYLIGSPAMREQLSVQGRQQAAGYSVHRMIDGYMDIMNTLLDRQPVYIKDNLSARLPRLGRFLQP